MTTLRLLRLGFLAGLLPLVACDEGGIRGLTSNDHGDATRAEYSREIIFVADDATAAAVLEFSTVVAGSTLRRTARAWAEGGSGWTPLYDLSWEGTPVRRAWRLVPHGPVRLRVGLDDEIESVMVRDGDAAIATLETGDFVSEWTPFRTAQLILREATLALGEEVMRGWIVDARFGVTPQAPNAAGATVAGPHGVVPPAVLPTAEVAQDEPALDTSAERRPEAATEAVGVGAATPVRSVRAVLFGADGAVLVLGATEAGLIGWLWIFDREVVLPVVTLSSLPDGRGWTVEAEAGRTLSGRLQLLDEELVPLSPRMVGGRVRAGDADLELRGVLLPGE